MRVDTDQYAERVLETFGHSSTFDLVPHPDIPVDELMRALEQRNCRVTRKGIYIRVEPIGKEA